MLELILCGRKSTVGYKLLFKYCSRDDVSFVNTAVMIYVIDSVMFIFRDVMKENVSF